ncbi:MAG: hypothetical protein N3A69_09015 [Leptospiraceae bacterium]|nr:hypothetical protein [Leptospiraceae bacterium]
MIVRFILGFSCITVLFFTLNFCKTEQIRENLEYSDDSTDGYYPPNHKRNSELLTLTRRLEGEISSFSGDFKMQIRSGEGLKTINNLDGKIYFDKSSMRLKIELLMPVLGLRLSQLVSNGKQIQIQSSESPTPIILPMGDIVILDPSTQKKISIPFPIIYHTITLNFSNILNSPEVKMNPTNKKIQFKSDGDTYIYTLYDNGLDSLEYHSSKKDLLAICKVPDSAKNGSHPPAKLVTKITEMKTGKDFSYIDIQYRNVKKVASLPESVFRF